MKFLIFISALIICCKPIEGQNSSKNSCELNLKQELIKHWSYDSDYKGYIFNEKFLLDLDSLYKDCLHGKDTSYISNLFGEHYKSGKGGGKFYMNFPLKPNSAGKGGTFYFIFNEKYKLEIDYFIGFGDVIQKD